MQVEGERREEKQEKPIDPLFVLNWLIDNQIVKHLFTNTHMELIRQSVDVLAFLASKNKLAIEDLDMLWEASLVSILFLIYQFASKFDFTVPHGSYVLVLKRVGMNQRSVSYLRRLSTSARACL